MDKTRRHGSGWLAVLEECPGCAEVEFGQVCGLAEEYCVVAWGYSRLEELKAQVDAELARKEEMGEEG